jgi:hypothetical protein
MVNNGDISALRKEIAELRGVARTNRRAAEQGAPWELLTVPRGASGGAWWRPAHGGHTEVRVSLTWRTVPAAAVLAGIGRPCWPRIPYQGSHGGAEVSVGMGGMVTVAGMTGPLNAVFSFPVY